MHVEELLHVSLTNSTWNPIKMPMSFSAVPDFDQWRFAKKPHSVLRPVEKYDELDSIGYTSSAEMENGNDNGGGGGNTRRGVNRFLHINALRFEQFHPTTTTVTLARGTAS